MNAEIQHPTVSAELWETRDVIAYGLRVAAGIVCAAVGWWVASGTAEHSRQVGCVIAAILAITLIGIANTGWLLSGHRQVSVRRHRLTTEIEAIVSRSTERVDRLPLDAPTYVSVDGASLYHRPQCRFVHGKRTVRLANPVQSTSQGACPVCVK